MNQNLLIALIVIVVVLSPFGYGFFIFISKKIRKFINNKRNYSSKSEILSEIATAIEALKKYKKGATIIFSNDDLIEKYVVEYEEINSNINTNLLISIFCSETSPLHDGAVVIMENKIRYASAYISELSNRKLPKWFGTRHRSSLGISEVTDSFVITLSEETGKVTIFKKGNYKVINSKDLLNELVNWNNQI